MTFKYQACLPAKVDGFVNHGTPVAQAPSQGAFVRDDAGLIINKFSSVDTRRRTERWSATG